ncbi:hypothetical protein [Laspinema olomoucense]|uniref:hypothetical protein n=1 Tax=Laspinema olomoucense TaxID=3231600 RepID=UPI0021BA9AEE|nr:hypothetical protein [Laspinema sp. D3d]MCT7975184.1 hypothetical protein [Laspinema sp. D3d]
MARPGGNPNFGKDEHAFTCDRPEPRDKLLQVRIEDSLLTRLKSLDNWQDLVRQEIAEILEKQGKGVPDHLKEVY